MIQISDKSQCCGCSSCAQRCSRGCITMVQDEEGFSYPQVDAASCIDCGLCEKVCPILNPLKAHEPLKVFAAKNPDEAIRKESSSGGIFSMLAESIIRDGGVVFGARWSDEWNVVHAYTETIEGLKSFRGSKYVQSNINGSYQKVETFLREGRKVLFCGTPCQIAGLKTYLSKEYDNLLVVECVCHGAPSPGLWQKYLFEISKGRIISYINHRDKCSGWRNYSVVIKFADKSEISEFHDDNIWTRAFIKNIDLRPSCYQCAFKTFNSLADISLGDLWGDKFLLPKLNNDKGITLVIVRTQKGSDAVKSIEKTKKFLLEDVVAFNGAIAIPSREHPRRSEFMYRLQKGESFTRLVRTMTKDPFTLRMKIMITKLMKL